ncbi:hypothetical protein Tco_1283895 [Tanacetum coccineum]
MTHDTQLSHLHHIRGGHLPLSSIFALREIPQDLKDQGLMCCIFCGGIVNRADIDYVERIWEEFTQCGRFTKLIINYLQSRHMFTQKSLAVSTHMPYDEYALVYTWKFSYKNTKRCKFGDDNSKYAYTLRKSVLLPIIWNMWQRLLSISGFSPGKKSVTMMHRLPNQLRGKTKNNQEASTHSTNKPKLKLQLIRPLINLSQPPNPNMHCLRPHGEDNESGFWTQLKLHLKLNVLKLWDEVRGGSVSKMNAQGQEEGQGGTNPGDSGVSQTPSSHVVHDGPNLDHMDSGIAEASSQPNTEQMDDEFTATAYLKVQENLKLPSEDEVRLEEPASSAGTMSSMKNLDRDLSFTDQFLVEKSQEDEPEKTNTEAEVQSMVTTIGQLEQNIADLVDANQALEERLDKQGNKIHQLETQDLSRLIREHTGDLRFDDYKTTYEEKKKDETTRT